ncbi:hypothetical protein [Sporolactobacillus laevolacticus]|uniref:Uncharacterized protein n=1 Tax=Sporolactobacillus laevolacticus DSM 442 TaxID=1395513 RepID=V6IXS6_9BACL|nr:hypothetical protein [Sporolactobacillus laevolacticus]EST12208.1 hypothetical protein P343_07800 [Sporolactobacillus laevolacticus DSM 442]
MDEVIFESSIIDKPIITADRNTRKLLTERAKILIQSTDFIEGKAAIREIDLDNKTVTARPLSFKDAEIEDITLKIPSDISTDTLMAFAAKIVYISGYLILNLKVNRLM